MLLQLLLFADDECNAFAVSWHSDWVARLLRTPGISNWKCLDKMMEGRLVSIAILTVGYGAGLWKDVEASPMLSPRETPKAFGGSTSLSRIRSQAIRLWIQASWRRLAPSLSRWLRTTKSPAESPSFVRVGKITIAKFFWLNRKLQRIQSDDKKEKISGLILLFV